MKLEPELKTLFLVNLEFYFIILIFCLLNVTSYKICAS